jgi:hypothetical protein
LFILSLIYSIVDSKDKKFTSETPFYNYTTYEMLMKFLFKDVVEICRIKWKFFYSFWNAYSLFTYLLFAVWGRTVEILALQDLLRYLEQTMNSESSTFSALFWISSGNTRNHTDQEMKIMVNEVEADHPDANAYVY